MVKLTIMIAIIDSSFPELIFHCDAENDTNSGKDESIIAIIIVNFTISVYRQCFPLYIFENVLQVKFYAFLI